MPTTTRSRCPNGTRKNKKTLKCEKKMNSKKIRSSKQPIQNTMMQINIQFTVPFKLYKKNFNMVDHAVEKTLIPMTSTIAKLMNDSSFKKANGRLSSENSEYFSDIFGEFKVDQYKLTPKDKELFVSFQARLDLESPDVILEFSGDSEFTLDQAEELISTILPAVYSNEYDYEFKKEGKYEKSFIKYGVHFTDTPSNIKWTVN
jgi:hypothetical protein